MRWFLATTLLFGLILPLPVPAQTLTLHQAVETALQLSPVLHAGEAGVLEASEGVRMAGAERHPRVSLSESYTRSNNPVFAFGSLLNQRRFGMENFQIDDLNHPDSLQNFQSLLHVEQTVYDFGRTRHALRAARLASDLSLEEQRAGRADVILAVAQAYFGAVLAARKLEVSGKSVQTAQADLRRSEALAEAGMATQADVLSARVHLAALREQQIQAQNDQIVARAGLNQVMGVDQGRDFQLLTDLTAPPTGPALLDVYLLQAAQLHADSRRARLSEAMAQEQVEQARRERWPEVVALGVLEGDRQGLVRDGGGNWAAGMTLRWEIWDGSGKSARVAGARHAQKKVEAVGRHTGSLVELRTRQAFFDHRSAAQRVEVAESSVQQAVESHRIIEDRYEAGLENVTALIRSQLAVMEARFRCLYALYDQRVSRSALEHAAGLLTPESEALK